MNNSNRKFLVFSLQDSLYALDVADVAEVADPPQMWPIPLAPAYYAGVLSFHGDIVAAMILSRFLGLRQQHQPGKIVVLRQEVASLAFLVDSIIRIACEEEVSFSSPPDSVFAQSTLTIIEGTAIQLDLKKLMCALENDMQGANQGQ
ncbi:MAG TPA: CheW domain-containing protein [Desulfuromonadales bacterium]|nr:CheW domain-containing protein [Desulfuromonadales bacterium]